MNKEFDVKNFEITDAFWAPRQRLVSETVIPYQEKVLNDEVPGIEKSHALANFRIAAGMEDGEFYGMVFQDSDVAKWLEGVAYSLCVKPDPELERRADEIIRIIAAAQQPDGYLDTYFIIKEPDRKFQNLQECHELYCAGHMMEAAVAYYEATGKDALLKVMQNVVDCIDSHIGTESGKIPGVPGHEEIEIGLLRMYRLTGEKKALKLAAYFINQRGVNPGFFDEETKTRGWIQWENSPHDTEYNQSFAPVRQQKAAKGHSVRAMYLYAAMADYAEISGDRSLAEACEALWNDVTQKQMYLTGGIGQVARWEGFTHAYDLPNDTAYAETCASIGLVMFAKRMLNLRADSKYADVMERALYNGILSGMQLDGKRFFYVNPLEVNPGVSGKLPGYEHVLTKRPEWFGCACCPPNVVRMIASLGKYAWDEKDGVIYSHLFVGGTAKFEQAVIRVESSYPWEGHIRYYFEKSAKKAICLAVRIPSYVKNAVISINEENVEMQRNDSGYAYLERVWERGDIVAVDFEMPVRRTYCNPLVRADENCVALQRGPFVYCFEGADNGENIQQLRIPEEAAFSVSAEPDGLLKGMKVIEFEGIRAVSQDGELYSEIRPEEQTVPMRAIPYFAWGNRGENQMRVWLPERRKGKE
ncbi:MAG: glycoside hydrolase family 127 protein [Eubacteriales bacterium]|nr:glycoside hydrolase family 127 protein [Eubacteriales bacterium]